MVAMCTIYEYFAAGRCTELNGADGAYNLYESELRQNLIINRLDTIIKQLDAIKANQYMLYTELKKTNEILEGISSDMKELTSTVHRIEDATHITACIKLSCIIKTHLIMRVCKRPRSSIFVCWLFAIHKRFSEHLFSCNVTFYSFNICHS